MLNRENVKIGIAPIAWTEDDMPEWGKENTFLQTISEIALSGYKGTEIGCQFPRDTDILNKEFSRRGISAITAWYSSYLNEKPYEVNERGFIDHMNFLKAIGAKHVVVSDQSHSIQHFNNIPHTDKYVITDEAEWKQLAEGLDKLGKIAVDNGMMLIYHHHMTTTVQRTNEIDKLMELTNPKYVNLLFDTGHLTFSGEDPVAILDKHFDRIKHIHLKDVRPDIMKRCRDKKLSFLKSVLEGVFTVPGDKTGSVDYPAIFKILEKRNYKGWLVVEAEQNPYIYNPLDYAKLARAYIKEQTGI
ncbi:myo-inosose-2 dehydratase [Clostridium tyrobutyricum]|jgi:inosose dehydratase|uniref:Inosose dehydratase n=1 Tax=Clostridium tyrobutyricum DIVETGP TaxID=1408889 RepID=W6N3N9_CLOTY|nr:myo-inosose-2 dehydratase [Clostridium tyrobutyricum]AND84012.1 inosose dehydratase [Clostridium tyrobutyricum]ANP68749.1 myo-inosose-2 dehydratase [Clostridium tyrobutyricum]MBV4415623.1 myo-inosose-2 dehydratase [Clostridium tyrobutyricum]MBV4422265.1 myo-inosose-2 dehydratase [Clostridium tyrobutyricum]MBV4424810.1 myo-inosose-2 dehydratase [Clostridium tyrobutyricum]